MSIESHGHEHELEPQFGLPERLPQGERILWQGSPDFAALARSAFHVRMLAVYFLVLLALRASTVLGGGGSLSEALAALAIPGLLAALALASITVLAWLTARTAVYTITNRRVVMRIGIVLTLTFNLPLRVIESADFRRGAGKCGDIVLKLAGTDHIALLHLWPHARPWSLARPQPMLRAVPDAQAVAAILAQAWTADTGIAANADAPADTPAGTPATNPTGAPAVARLQPAAWQPSPT
jgi:hypothetical protein